MFLLVTVLAAWVIGTTSAGGQTSNFTYQGRLKVGGGNPPPGQLWDLRFSFFDAPSEASPKLGETFVQGVVTDSDGLFTVQVDASPMWDNISQMHWVELGARRAGTTSNYVILTPRQRISPVPISLHAQSADVATSFAGVISPANLPASVARLDIPQTFTAPPSFMPPTGVPFTVGITTTVQNLSADLLDGLNSTAFWRRETNDGVSRLAEPAKLPFEIRVQNRPVLRLQEGRSNLGWSLAADPAINTIREGVAGSAVFGRGSLVESNADYSFVAGDGNQILTGARNSTIAGGAMNRINPDGLYAFVGGGNFNEVSSRFASVLLGSNNKVWGDFSAVLSGENNRVEATYAAVFSGGANQIQTGANLSAIASGQQNIIHSNAYASVIVGGQLNQIQQGANRSFLGGGDYNEIGPASYEAFIGGGTHNKIEFNSPYAPILAGYGNLVRSNSASAFVPWGVNCVVNARAVAAGHQANALHSGSIVLADGQSSSFFSSNVNEFAVRAAGGVRFVTAGAGLTVDGLRLTSGGGSLLIPAGAVANSNLADGAVTSPKVAANQLLKSLNGLRDDVTLSVGAGLTLTSNNNGLRVEIESATADTNCPNCYWELDGNAGTTAGINFLGTTDNQALELKVNTIRALRLQPDDTFVCDTVAGTTGLANSPSLVAGYSGNFIPAGIPGAIIAGGGAAEDPCLNGPGVPMPNIVTAQFASILGGLGNANHGALSAIGGGVRNTITSGGNYSHIANGVDNLIDSTDASSILGGAANRISFDADAAVIAGGQSNLIETNNDFASIGGGFANKIWIRADGGTISGGTSNTIDLGRDATIGGGKDNFAGWGGAATVGGGNNNRARGAWTTVGGGTDNTASSTWATVGGGYNNTASGDGAVVGGGGHNGFNPSGNTASGAASTVSGGEGNTASGWYSTIGGGSGNTASGLNWATVGGGFGNNNGGEFATIGGGAWNRIVTNADYATIPGGRNAQAINYGQQAYAGGRFATNGDAQSSLYVLRGVTTNAAPQELFLDGETRRLLVPTGGAWTYDILLVATLADELAVNGYQIRGVIKHTTAGVTSLVGAPTQTVLAAEAPAWVVTVEADDANHALMIKVTGTTAKTIRWVATVRTVEVVF